MRGEDGSNADMAEQVLDSVTVQPGLAQSGKGASYTASLRSGTRADLRRKPPSFAVVRLGEVDQLEEEGEGARESVGCVGSRCELVDA